MSLYASYDMAWCDRCHGERPHSKKGNCLATHRVTPLATVTPMRRTESKGGYPAGDKAVSDLKPPPPALRSPRRRFDQVKVRAAVAALLAGEVTLQQAARDVGCDLNYLHKRAWKAAKDAVKVRDDMVCQHCGYHTAAPMECHHRITRGAGGSSNPLVAYYLPNLVLLCHKDHRWVTDHPREATALGLSLPHGIVHDPAHTPIHIYTGTPSFQSELVFLTPAGGRRTVPDKEPA